MADVVDRITRSRMMSGIRGKNTQPELLLRRALHAGGFRYRLHAKELPGRPDIVLPKFKAAIQVHGCFWHRHRRCIFCTKPGSNIQFWTTKFAETVARDKRNISALKRMGWRTAVVWECALDPATAEAVAGRLARWLKSRSNFAELPLKPRKSAVRRRT
jgi:DNA mismatch endonuclease, patch repair protein